MGKSDAGNNSESRTASARGQARGRGRRNFTTLSANVNSAASSPGPAGRRRRKRLSRRKKSQNLQDPVPMGGNFSKLSEVPSSSHPTDPNHSPPSPTPSSLHSASDDASSIAMSISSTRIGKNRLVAGFARPRSSPDLTTLPTNLRDSHKPRLDSTGTSRHDAIEISDSEFDEEMDDSESGMVVNLESSTSRDSQHAEDQEMDSASEDGQIPEQRNRHLPQSTAMESSNDFASSKFRLANLNPDELQEQIRYTLYHLDRGQIDLNRPIICLACLREGHMPAECPEIKCTNCGQVGTHSSRLCPTVSRCALCHHRGHVADQCTAGIKVGNIPCDICGALRHTEQNCAQRFFPRSQAPAGAPVKLWISCCICASKSHLVGDCPDAERSTAARWSLKSLEPSQITNLSLQTGTRDLEIEAEGRGMRPKGLQIKGRAGFYHAGTSSSVRLSDDENDSFIRAPVGPRQEPSRPQVMMGSYQPERPQPHPDRYDRFNAPSERGYVARGRNTWYGTDSFGRRRSRSPRAQASGDSYRPSSRRSQSPRRFDSYRQHAGPPPSDCWQRHPANAAHDRYPDERERPRHATAPHPPPARGAKLELPTRKGSNPHLPANPPRNAQQQGVHNQQNSTGTAGSRKKGKQLKSTASRPATNKTTTGGACLDKPPAPYANSPVYRHLAANGFGRADDEDVAFLYEQKVQMSLTGDNDIAAGSSDENNALKGLKTEAHKTLPPELKDDNALVPEPRAVLLHRQAKIPPAAEAWFESENFHRRIRGMAPITSIPDADKQRRKFLMNGVTGERALLAVAQYGMLVDRSSMLEQARRRASATEKLVRSVQHRQQRLTKFREESKQFADLPPNLVTRSLKAVVDMQNAERRAFSLWDLTCLRRRSELLVLDPVIEEESFIGAYYAADHEMIQDAHQLAYGDPRARSLLRQTTRTGAHQVILQVLSAPTSYSHFDYREIYIDGNQNDTKSLVPPLDRQVTRAKLPAILASARPESPLDVPQSPPRANVAKPKLTKAKKVESKASFAAHDKDGDVVRSWGERVARVLVVLDVVALSIRSDLLSRRQRLL